AGIAGGHRVRPRAAGKRAAPLPHAADRAAPGAQRRARGVGREPAPGAVPPRRAVDHRRRRDRPLARALRAVRLASALGRWGRAVPDPAAALVAAKERAGEAGLLLITGSIYLLGELIPLAPHAGIAAPLP